MTASVTTPTCQVRTKTELTRASNETMPIARGPQCRAGGHATLPELSAPPTEHVGCPGADRASSVSARAATSRRSWVATATAEPAARAAWTAPATAAQV